MGKPPSPPVPLHIPWSCSVKKVVKASVLPRHCGECNKTRQCPGGDLLSWSYDGLSGRGLGQRTVFPELIEAALWGLGEGWEKS